MGVEYEIKTNEFSKNYFSHGSQMCLLAQHIEKPVPEAVNEKDGYKGVDYAGLVPLLIECIKVLNIKIELQKKKKHEIKNEKNIYYCYQHVDNYL